MRLTYASRAEASNNSPLVLFLRTGLIGRRPPYEKQWRTCPTIGAVQFSSWQNSPRPLASSASRPLISLGSVAFFPTLAAASNGRIVTFALAGLERKYSCQHYFGGSVAGVPLDSCKGLASFSTVNFRTIFH